MIIVLTGPAGSGKTVIGQALSASLGWTFLDADDLHDELARTKMAEGIPLDDTDRLPWLGRVGAHMKTLTNGVVACSALRKAYRDLLVTAAPDVRFVLLDADARTLAARVAARPQHFMPPSLVPSQLATLERSPDMPAVDATQPIDQVVAQLRALVGVP